MPELRKDPITGRWVIIATERARSPRDYLAESAPPQGGSCPFCPGNEHDTPPEISALAERAGREPNGPGWSVRVIPNKFPALRVEGDMRKSGKGIYDLMAGVGAHEVIVETPAHDVEMADLSEAEVAGIVATYRDRVADLRNDRRLKYALIFKNHGRTAGASLDHPHSQLIATPVVPKRVLEELKGAVQYYEYRERCIFCDIVRQELRDRERLVAENGSCVAVAPFASRFPFETWILPRVHAADVSEMDETMVHDLAAVLRDTLSRLKRTLNDPAYNFMVHTLPFNDENGEAYHWHVEVIPKLTSVAGFEWGSGFYINPTPPEQAARALQETL